MPAFNIHVVRDDNILIEDEAQRLLIYFNRNKLTKDKVREILRSNPFSNDINADKENEQFIFFLSYKEGNNIASRKCWLNEKPLKYNVYCFERHYKGKGRALICLTHPVCVHCFFNGAIRRNGARFIPQYVGFPDYLGRSITGMDNKEDNTYHNRESIKNKISNLTVSHPSDNKRPIYSKQPPNEFMFGNAEIVKLTPMSILYFYSICLLIKPEITKSVLKEGSKFYKNTKNSIDKMGSYIEKFNYALKFLTWYYFNNKAATDTENSSFFAVLFEAAFAEYIPTSKPMQAR